MATSRRRFVQLSAGAAALAMAGRAGALGAEPAASGARRGETLLHGGDPEVARAVAMTALDAARRAGASYADVRVDDAVSQSVDVWKGRASGPVRYDDRFEYGVRVLVNGQWGFAGDQDPTPDVVARCAERAVAQGKASSRDRRAGVVLAAAPVVRGGTWATHVVEDPFEVAIGEQEALLVRVTETGRRVRGVTDVGGGLAFSRIVRTFASSEGSTIAQRVVVARPSLTAYAAVPDGSYGVGRRVVGVQEGQGGYELVRGVSLEAGIVAAAEAAVAATAAHAIDVGRYDIVVSASVMASMVRALVESAAMGGVVMGRTIAVPILSVVGDRSLAGGMATVGWDDEGVAPEMFAIIDGGVLVDRPTSRALAEEMGAWYAGRTPGRAARSHGCAVGGGLTTPRVGNPNLTMAPGGDAGGVRELISGVRRGLYFSDEASGGGSAGVAQWSASAVQEIREGRLVGYVRDAAFQVRSGELWQALDAIGGADSVEQITIGGASVRAVPGRFRRMNVVSTGAVV